MILEACYHWLFQEWEASVGPKGVGFSVGPQMPTQSASTAHSFVLHLQAN